MRRGSGRLTSMDDAAEQAGPGMTAKSLAHDLDRLFETYRIIADEHPTSHPLLRLALEISQRLESGVLDHDSLSELVQHLTVNGFATRAEKLSSYSGETDPDRNAAIIREIAARQTR